jgi:hypothetical protein
MAAKKQTAPTTSNVPATTATKALTQPGGPVDLRQEMMADVGAGTENVQAGDMAIPFLNVLQALSPQIASGLIPGAKVGDLLNTVTNEIYKKALLIPCAFNKAWVEWIPKTKGGGFVAQHPTDALMAETTRDEKGNDVLRNGNHLVQTAYHYCLMVKEDGSVHRVVVSMTRTKLKKSRKWVSQIMDLKLPIGPNGALVSPPSFSHMYEVSTEDERNKVGQVYKNYAFGDPIPVTNRDLYLLGRAFHQEVMKGLVVVTPPSDDLPVDEAATAAGGENHF